MLSLAVVVPGPRRAQATVFERQSSLIRATASGGSSEADAALWTAGLAAAAYFSAYASEGYEPHRL